MSFQLAKNTKLPSLAFYHALFLAAERYLTTIAPGKLQDFLTRTCMQLAIPMASLPDNYENFLQVVKRLHPSLDTVRISNIYIRYMKGGAFGQAVLEELDGPLQLEILFNNAAVLDG